MKAIDSPYTKSQIILYDEGDYSLDRNMEIYPDTPDDIYHLVKEDDTLTSLANKYYGSGRYWYIIADKNDLMDIFYLQIGTMLTIPSKNYI